MALWRRTGEKPETLRDGPQMPQGCEHVWAIFNEMHGVRGSNGFAPNRLGFIELDAYQRVRGVKLSEWEIDAIRRADRCYLAHYKAMQPPQT